MDLYRKISKLKRSPRSRDVRIKLELFLLAIKLDCVSEARARRGFSRRFYYKWWNRLKNSGFKLPSLEEKSKRNSTERWSALIDGMSSGSTGALSRSEGASSIFPVYGVLARLAPAPYIRIRLGRSANSGLVYGES